MIDDEPPTPTDEWKRQHHGNLTTSKGADGRGRGDAVHEEIKYRDGYDIVKERATGDVEHVINRFLHARAVFMAAGGSLYRTSGSEPNCGGDGDIDLFCELIRLFGSTRENRRIWEILNELAQPLSIQPYMDAPLTIEEKRRIDEAVARVMESITATRAKSALSLTIKRVADQVPHIEQYLAMIEEAFTAYDERRENACAKENNR